MKISYGTIVKQNDFFSDRTKNVVDYNITVVKGIPYFTVVYEELPEERDYGLEFTIVQVRSHLFSINELVEPNLPFFYKVFEMNNTTKLGILMRTELAIENNVEPKKEEMKEEITKTVKAGESVTVTETLDTGDIVEEVTVVEEEEQKSTRGRKPKKK